MALPRMELQRVPGAMRHRNDTKLWSNRARFRTVLPLNGHARSTGPSRDAELETIAEWQILSNARNISAVVCGDWRIEGAKKSVSLRSELRVLGERGAPVNRLID